VRLAATEGQHRAGARAATSLGTGAGAEPAASMAGSNQNSCGRPLLVK